MTTTYQKIKSSQKSNEREILRRIRQCNRIGRGWNPVNMSIPWWNALDRLVERGEVRFDKDGYNYGYVVVLN